MTTPANRVAAGKARALVDTWLRQKYRRSKKKSQVKAHERCGTRVPEHERGARTTYYPDRMRTAGRTGNTPKPEQLKAFRLWMWDANMLSVKDREDKHGHATYLAYRQQLREACDRFDAMMEQGSTTAKGRRRGSGFTVGSAKSKPKPNH